MWEFPTLSGPTVFIAAPGDVKYLRDIVIREHAMLSATVGDDHGVGVYHWLVDKSEDGFVDWLPAQGQIPNPSDPNCRAVICMFGERIGTPLPADFPISSIGRVDPEAVDGAPHLSHPFEPASVKHGGFALTGTVFEYLAAVEANSRSGTGGRNIGQPPVMLLFVGDESLRSETDPRNANWGGQLLFEQARARIPKRGERSQWETGQYNLEIAQLRNFFDYVGRRGVVPLIVQNADEAQRAIRRFLTRALDLQPGQSTEPFKGLAIFDTSDSTVFFGRDDERRQAVEALGQLFDDPDRPTSLGIVGGSGVGKSSFMRAGVVARLCHAVSAGYYRACVVSASELVASATEPTGPALLHRLFGKALAVATGNTVRSEIGFLEQLASERQPTTAVEMLCSILRRQSDPWRLVIAIDEFEELVDRRVDPDRAQLWEPVARFIAAAARSDRIGVVYAIQTNRLSLLAADNILGLLWARGSTLPLAFPSHSLTDIIAKPFEYVGVSVDPRFVVVLRERILAFAEGADPGSQGSLLPLVSMVLRRIFDVASRMWAQHNATSPGTPRELMLDAVSDQLDVAGAIAAEADRAANEAAQAAGPEWSDEVIGNLFRRLVRLNAGDHERLSLPFAPALAMGATQRLADALQVRRMLLAEPDGRIKLVHEVVCHSWPPARAWLERERHVLTLVGLLGFRAEEWSVTGRPELSAQTTGTRDLDEAAEVLALWNAVLHGSEPFHVAAADAAIRDYCFAVLASQPSPNRVIEAAPEKSTHVFLAAAYNRVELLRRYLELEPTSASFKRRDGRTPLFSACNAGCTEALEALLTHGADPNHVENGGWAPLHVAAYVGNRPAVSRLLAAGAVADPRAPTSPIELAARQGHLAIVRLLLDAGVDPDAAGHDKATALHSAAAAGNLELVRLLLERGARVDARQSDGCTPIHRAVDADQLAMVKALVRAGASVELTWSRALESSAHAAWLGREFELTPLQVACDRGRHDIARALLEGGADSNRKFELTAGKVGRRRWSLLHHAVERNDRDLVRLLIEWRADLQIVDSFDHTPLGRALVLRHTEIARDLVHAGASLQRVEGKGSYLQVFAKLGDLQSVEFLIDAGSDPDAGAPGTDPPLILASRTGAAPVVALLLDKGAALGARGLGGRGLLHAAVASGDAALLDLLIERGAALDQTDSDGRTALHLAVARADRRHIAKCLIERGADREARDRLDMTPLHVASQHGQDASVELLLAAGAAVHARDAAGWTALHFAAQTADQALIERVIAAGAALDAVATFPAVAPLALAAQIGNLAIMALLQGDQPPPPPGLRRRRPDTQIHLALTTTRLTTDARQFRSPFASEHALAALREQAHGFYPPRVCEAVQRRDAGVCCACGFRADRYQDVVCLGSNVRDLDDLVTICTFCVGCLRLDLMGEDDRGVLVYLPELAQAEVSHAARELYVARQGKAPLAVRARAVLERIKTRRERATRLLGTDDPAELAHMLHDAATTDRAGELAIKLAGIRLLPGDSLPTREGGLAFNAFGPVLTYWRSSDGPCHDVCLGTVPWIARLELLC